MNASSLIDMSDLDVVTQLTDTLGPIIVALVAGNRDQYVAEKWLMIKPSCKPSPSEIAKLRKALECFERITATEGATVARSWLIGSNEMFGGTAPVFNFDEHDLDAMDTSVSRFLDELR